MSDNDCVKVAIRIRPLVKSEVDRGCQTIIEKLPNEPQVHLRTNNSFTFNYVFSPDDTQEFIYESAVSNVLEKLFLGYNVTILAYGQTGSGKTHTMGTAFSGIFDSSTGVIPRVITDIFTKISNLTSCKTTTVSCSFVELYQEQLYDLLSPNSREQSIVDIREDGTRGIVIPNLTEKFVTSAKETTDSLIKGSAGRAVGATAMNTQSSRSHAIFTINITLRDEENPNNSTSSKFHLVDLAGSERAQKTKATGDRFKEGVKINQGLLALGNVISALGSGSNNGYVGYRDSKLTRLLRDSLGGNSVTLMIACVSPADYNLDETLSTLRYADRAKRIKNKPIVNQDPKSAEINKLNNIIQKLRMELMNRGTSDCTNSNSEVEILRQNLENCIGKNKILQQQLQVTINDVAENEMRAAFSEAAYDELQHKFVELKQNIFALVENLDEKSCPVEFMELPQKIKNYFIDLDSTIQQTKDQMLDQKRSVSISNGYINQDGDTTDVVQKKMEAFTSKQLDFNNELRRLNRELSLKEELHQKVAGNLTKFCSYEGENNLTGKIKEFESTIHVLEMEKTELLDKLKSSKGKASAKIAEERRIRLQQLEQKINELRKVNVQQAKLLQLREKETQKIENLNREIQEMKATKVKLVRAMKAESESFRQWKLNREKELTQLKEKDRKRQNEMVRMESLHNKQTNVLKRKVEEANAINKRLKDALEKQRTAQSQRRNAKSGKLDLTWIDKELEVILSAIDAEFALEQLMEDRAVINNRLQLLKNTPSESNNEIEETEDELQMRNAQINDIQQKIIASDIESKIKTISDGIQNIPEAKTILKQLLSVLIDLRKEYIAMKNKNEEYKSSVEITEEKMQNLKKKIDETENKYCEKISNIEKSNEEKIVILLRELNTVAQFSNGQSTPEVDERMKIQQETLDKLDSLREELEFYKEKCQQHESNTFKKPQNKRVQQITGFDYLEISTDEEFMDNLEDDPDWVKTPMYIRKTKNKSDESVLKGSKRSFKESVRCSCSSNCNSKRCSCRKNVVSCSENCKCADSCNNKYPDDAPTFIVDSIKTEDKDTTEIEHIGENDHTPKKIKLSVECDDTLDVTTTRYPYAKKQRKPFFE